MFNYYIFFKNFKFKVTYERAVLSGIINGIMTHKLILVQVQEKAAAQAEYQAAMQRRQTAILLEETTPDIFQIKVGHLSPGAGAKVGPLIPTAGSTGLY